MEIPKNLKDEIWDYCRINNISNIDDFSIKMLKQGYTVEKYGATPVVRETIVEKEVEKIVEVPVEKIVEKIVEVPVEKEVYVTNDIETKKMATEIDRLQSVVSLQSLSIENSEKQIRQLTLDLTEAKKQLEEEKTKKRKDIYGEY